MNSLRGVLLFQGEFCVVDYDFYLHRDGLSFDGDHHQYIYIKNVPLGRFGIIERIAERNNCEILSFAPYSLPFGGGDIKSYIFPLKRK